MNVSAAFISDSEPPELRNPGESPLYDPAMFPKVTAAFDTLAGDAMLDTAISAGVAAARIIVSFIGMEFLWPMAWTSTLSSKRRDGVEKRLKHPAVMDIGTGQKDGKRNTLSISNDVPLRARTPAIRRTWPCCFAPLLAAIDALSMQARLQSSRSAL